MPRLKFRLIRLICWSTVSECSYGYLDGYEIVKLGIIE
ncbi:hypothetical protein [Salmonella phage SD-6_S16]|nr:hypothetical protein [Salmonella phage SD-6_S16]